MVGANHALAFEKARLLLAQADGVAAAACFVGQGDVLQTAVHRPGADAFTPEAPPWFRIGSLTKTLVAFAALHHATLTGHDPDADIGGELSHLVGGSFGGPVSLIALLSHTAGLHNCSVLDEPGPVIASATALRYDRARGVFSYSNAGYGLVGEWLSHRTGLDFSEWLDIHALRVLGQPAIALRPAPDAPSVAGHVMDPRLGARTAITLPFDGGRLAPAGYLWATASGLGDLLRALLRPPDAVAASVVSRMTKAASPVFGPQDVAAGAGLFVMRRGGRRIAFNEGEIGGFRSRIELDLDAGTGLAEMAAYSGAENGATGSILGGIGAVRPPDRSRRPAPRILSPAAGATYVAPELGVFQCEDPRTMHGARLNGVAATLEPAGPDLWRGSTEEGRMLTVRRNSGHGGDSLTINGILAPASRLRPRARPFDARWLGRYRNGYWIDIAEVEGEDGVVQVSSNYGGIGGHAVVIGANVLATDMGLAVFGGPVTRARLRLLGTAIFRRPSRTD